MRDQIKAETERDISALSRKFGDLLKPTPRENDLRAECAVNCPPVLDELNRLNAKRAEAMDEVASQIHGAVDAYVLRTVGPNDADLDRQSMAQDLKQILGGAFDQAPSTFVLNFKGAHALIVVYAVHKGPFMGDRATSVSLRAYNATDAGLTLADFTGDNMDGYANLTVIELHSPLPDEKWLLLSGNMV
jgi:hypothetical protein